MNLREYLFINKISCKDFAKKIGYATSYVVNVKNNRMIPGKKMRFIMDKIAGIPLDHPKSPLSVSKEKENTTDDQKQDQKTYVTEEWI